MSESVNGNQGQIIKDNTHEIVRAFEKLKDDAMKALAEELAYHESKRRISIPRISISRMQRRRLGIEGKKVDRHKDKIESTEDESEEDDEEEESDTDLEQEGDKTVVNQGKQDRPLTSTIVRASTSKSATNPQHIKQGLRNEASRNSVKYETLEEEQSGVDGELSGKQEDSFSALKWKR